ACLTAGPNQPEHKKSDTPPGSYIATQHGDEVVRCSFLSNGYNLLTRVSTYRSDALPSPTFRTKEIMSTDIRADGKQPDSSAYERKMARHKPGLLPQALLDDVAREHGEYLRGLRKRAEPEFTSGNR
ncbi:hypothetical protein, partial [Pseudomonas syringae]